MEALSVAKTSQTLCSKRPDLLHSSSSLHHCSTNCYKDDPSSYSSSSRYARQRVRLECFKSCLLSEAVLSLILGSSQRPSGSCVSAYDVAMLPCRSSLKALWALQESISLQSLEAPRLGRFSQVVHVACANRRYLRYLRRILTFACLRLLSFDSYRAGFAFRILGVPDS